MAKSERSFLVLVTLVCMSFGVSSVCLTDQELFDRVLHGYEGSLDNSDDSHSRAKAQASSCPTHRRLLLSIHRCDPARVTMLRFNDFFG